MDSQNLGNKTQKKKVSYGKLLIIVIVAVGVGNHMIEQSLQSQSMSTFTAFLFTVSRAILDMAMLYLLVLWVADLATRRRGGIDDPRSRRVKKIINITAAIILLISIGSLLLVFMGSTK